MKICKMTTISSNNKIYDYIASNTCDIPYALIDPMEGLYGIRLKLFTLLMNSKDELHMKGYLCVPLAKDITYGINGVQNKLNYPQIDAITIDSAI